MTLTPRTSKCQAEVVGVAERDAIECHRPEARPVGAHEAVSGEPRLWRERC
jgi:hypothetical protein